MDPPIAVMRDHMPSTQTAGTTRRLNVHDDELMLVDRVVDIRLLRLLPGRVIIMLTGCFSLVLDGGVMAEQKRSWWQYNPEKFHRNVEQAKNSWANRNGGPVDTGPERNTPTSPGDDRYCGNCGSPVAPSARFCTSCGSGL